MITSEIILKYFPELSVEQIDQFNQLYDLYEDWNSQINVVSRKDIQELYLRHVLHSLAIVKVISFEPGSKVLDVGTGGGFPGVPLAIMFPETQFTLVDSIGKKIKVVEGVVDALGLKNVEAIHGRAENVGFNYDMVVTRAVARMKSLRQWVNNKLSDKDQHSLANGIIALKGGDLEEELKEATKKFQVWDIKDWFEEDFFETKKVVYVPKRK